MDYGILRPLAAGLFLFLGAAALVWLALAIPFLAVLYSVLAAIFALIWAVLAYLTGKLL